MVTSPTPERSAPVAASTAAPVFPIDPATIKRCPKAPLCAPRARRGNAAAASASSSRNSVGWAVSMLAGGMPMSATTSSPISSQAGGSTWPRFAAANVTVSAARAVFQLENARVGRDARRQVDRHDRPAVRVPLAERVDREGGEPRGCLAQPGPEHRVDRHVGLRHAPFDRAPRLGVGDLADAPARPLAGLEVQPRVPRDLVLPREQQRLRDRAEPARDHEAVAAVHPAAAQHDHVARVREALGHEPGDGRAGVLHQERPGKPDAARSRADRPAASRRR